MCDTPKLEEDMQRVKHILEGQNGNPEDGLVYKFVAFTTETRGELRHLKRSNWLILATLIGGLVKIWFFP